MERIALTKKNVVIGIGICTCLRARFEKQGAAGTEQPSTAGQSWLSIE